MVTGMFIMPRMLFMLFIVSKLARGCVFWINRLMVLVMLMMRMVHVLF